MTEKNHPLDTTPLPRAQPCMGTVDLSSVKKRYRLEFDSKKGIYWPVPIEQHEHGDPQ